MLCLCVCVKKGLRLKKLEVNQKVCLKGKEKGYRMQKLMLEGCEHMHE